jgi:hypothetical protein
MNRLHGSASEILKFYANGYYFHAYADNGRLVLVSKDTQEPFALAEDVEHFVEIIIGTSWYDD